MIFLEMLIFLFIFRISPAPYNLAIFMTTFGGLFTLKNLRAG